MLERFAPIADGLDHPEGVTAGPDGTVYAGGEAGQIYRIDLDGPTEIGSTGGFLYGVTLDGDGNVYGCDFGRAEVVRSTPQGEITSYATGTGDRPVRVPNFAAFDDAGALYVTDSGGWRDDDGLVFRFGPDGTAMVWSEEPAGFPNGCCLTVEGDALLVIETTRRRVVRVPILDDGSAGPMEVVVDLPGSLPDGMALATDGTMFVGCWRPDRVWRIPPGGDPEVLADDPDGVTFNQPANVAFIGPDRDRLAVSSLGGWSIVAADVGATGARLRYPSIG
ncbi:MAG TPA: SMP-30/gluconolactonase/LRE family protein [Actinomycetota bacterium]